METDPLPPFTLVAVDPGERVFDEAFVRYGQRLVAVAQSRMGTRLQAKVDAEDIVQSVFRSFCQRARQGQFHCEDWNDLWALLVTITIRKCINRQAHFLAGRRDIRREFPTEADNMTWADLASREPTPYEASVLVEEMERLFAPLDDLQRTVAGLFLQGYTVAEISQHVGRAERTTRRIIAQIRAHCARMQNAESVDSPAVR